MAGNVKLLAGLVFCGLAQGLAAQTLTDPTRPPAAFVEQAANTPAAVPAEVGRLQSVLIPRHGKPLAVIGGQAVRLGEKFGPARLVAVSEREVVLRGPEGVERLFLTPGIEKTGMNAGRTGRRAAAKKDMS